MFVLVMFCPRDLMFYPSPNADRNRSSIHSSIIVPVHLSYGLRRLRDAFIGPSPLFIWCSLGSVQQSVRISFSLLHSESNMTALKIS